MKLILVLLLHILTNITPLFAQWTQLNNELGVSIDKFEFFGNELFVLSNGVISKSSDFAESWIRLDYPKNCEINDIVSFSNSIYLATDNGVYKSSTNGATWSDRSFGFFDKRIRELEYQDSTMFAIDYYYSLYLSTDKGNSWERFSSSNFSGSGIKSLSKMETGFMFVKEAMFINGIFLILKKYQIQEMLIIILQTTLFVFILKVAHFISLMLMGIMRLK